MRIRIDLCLILHDIRHTSNVGIRGTGFRMHTKLHKNVLQNSYM